MSNTRARDEYMHWCGRYGLPVYFAEKILRHASTVQCAAEVDCSFADERLRTYWETRDARAQAAIKTALDEHETSNGGKWFVTFDGDPRGCCVRIACRAGALRNEYGVPARGFTSAQFARLERVNDARQRQKWAEEDVAPRVPAHTHDECDGECPEASKTN